MRYGRRDYRIFRHSKRLNFFPTFLAATGAGRQIISGIRYDALLITRFGRPGYPIGKTAVPMLISLINHNECGIPAICRELLIEGRWVDGDTLPRKN
jgi:hypothetical protein